MCWSGSASIVATAVGAVATGYAVKKKVPKARTFALGFFTLMELLQALSYIWIGQCDVSGNQMLTYLSLTHIAFQIPVANAFMLSYISVEKRKKWFKPVMIASFIGTVLMLTKTYVPVLWSVPKEWMCKTGDVFCSDNACSYMGNWHLAWRLPLLGFDPGNSLYFLLTFILPIMYGSWRIVIFHFIFGPFLAIVLTSNRSESAAIWCLFSIAILIAIFFSPLKRWFETPMRKDG